jgi:[histone H3]-lysine36 N-dimethyltransferase SETMAR
MSKARDFVAALARAVKSYGEIKEMVDAAFGDQTLKQMAIYMHLLKARVHKSCMKEMVMAFFDSRGLIYTPLAPRGATINADYTIMVLGNFMEHLRKKRPLLLEEEWWFHWDNAPVHTAVKVKEWFAAKSIRRLEQAPYSPDLAPADFFLFRRVKEGLAGKTLDNNSLKKTWEGVTGPIATDDYATAFLWWYERCEKCFRIGGDYVEKSSSIFYCF